jgi:hypothetical protein
VRTLRWAAAPGLVAVGIACNALVGIPGGLSDNGSADAAVEAEAGELDAGDAAPPVCPEDAAMGNLCHECRNEYCCGVYLACHESTACGNYIDCVSACPTQSCTLSCVKANDAGHAIGAPYLACAGLHCPGPCGVPDGGGCLDCEEANCAMQIYSCRSDPDCDELFICASACGAGNDACIQGCKKGLSSGTQQLYELYYACGLMNCTSICL